MLLRKEVSYLICIQEPLRLVGGYFDVALGFNFVRKVEKLIETPIAGKGTSHNAFITETRTCLMK